MCTRPIMNGHGKYYAEHHNWMQSVKSYHAYNILSKLLFSTARKASNMFVNTANNTACHQQTSIQHISPEDKSYSQQPTNYRCLLVLS